ncbi:MULTISPECIES: peptidylprolyl isomerase [unclassified Rhizobium]|uniref:peptidylprolyl isomerase n=1 Tax=unclassified Rhizobium TaxID=2613769 RepID=UPI0006FA56AE|nr:MULTISPECIES: peptidylprolyl isomerase [unclassified Rhizobium]KQV43391.1 molecular chaperone SurA [Rhizobium sp. Root1212]KRD37576.1 molecular chaperone SurA [Rhizobium sp. Root268]
MGGTFSMKRALTAALVAGLLAGSVVSTTAPAAYAASSVAVIVNNVPITSGDVAKRVAFMRLQRQGGGAAEARKQLIDEALKREEILRLRVSVSSADVDAAVGRFAASNKMTVQQLGGVLDKAGVTLDHFKQYVAVAMSWPRAVNLRYRAGNNGRLSNEELVRRMQENGGQKPVTTEYFLQQVIFVVPASKRNAILGKRQAEANASRANFPGCEQAKVYAATMRDVSIRNLGRMMIQEIPEDWKGLVEKAGDGKTTGTRVTEKGVEYLAICKKRQVNDDLAAEVVFRAEDLGKKKEGGEDPNSVKYLDELRSKAQILNK